MQLDNRSVRREPAITVLVAGVILALIGTAGDMIWHAMHPAEHVELFSLGSGETPWHAALFSGIAMGAVGAVMWAVRLRSDGGTILGATIALMLLVTTAATAWTVASDGGHQEAEATGTRGLAVADGHAHADAGEPVAADGAASDGGTSVIAGEGASHTHAEPQPLTAEEQVQVDAILADVKAATVQYKDIEVAKADGYRQVTQFIPGLGLHMFNFKYAGTFDPLKPQLLLYMPKADGSMKLAGVSYMLPHRSEVAPEGFPGGADVWHYHENLCFLRGGSVTIATKTDCAALGGFHQGQTGWLLHAWIYVKNPGGVFTEDNPVVA
jgi:hypothetical protein